MGAGGSWGRPGALVLTQMFVTCPSFSALHHAALNGNTELITLLLEAQAAVDIKDNKGKACQGLRARGRELKSGVPRELDGPLIKVSPQSLRLGLGRASWDP